MKRRFTILTACAMCAAAVCAFAQHPPLPAEAPPARWDRETLELFGALPVQDGGRIKPMATFAAFKLLNLRGMRSWRGPERPGDNRRERMLAGMTHPELAPVEWLMDTLFYPRAAASYPVYVDWYDDVQYGRRRWHEPVFPVNTLVGAGIGAAIGHQSHHRNRGALIGGSVGLLFDLARWSR